MQCAPKHRSSLPPLLKDSLRGPDSFQSPKEQAAVAKKDVQRRNIPPCASTTELRENKGHKVIRA